MNVNNVTPPENQSWYSSLISLARWVIPTTRRIRGITSGSIANSNFNNFQSGHTAGSLGLSLNADLPYFLTKIQLIKQEIEILFKEERFVKFNFSMIEEETEIVEDNLFLIYVESKPEIYGSALDYCNSLVEISRILEQKTNLNISVHDICGKNAR